MLRSTSEVLSQVERYVQDAADRALPRAGDEADRRQQPAALFAAALMQVRA